MKLLVVVCSWSMFVVILKSGFSRVKIWFVTVLFIYVCLLDVPRSGFNIRQMLLEMARCVDTPCWRQLSFVYLKNCILRCGCFVRRRWTEFQRLFSWTTIGLKGPKGLWWLANVFRELLDIGSFMYWHTIHTHTLILWTFASVFFFFFAIHGSVV